ncbi:MAG TPA: DUF116 domain-containing protein [Planctomycetota bacterium]|nr:DUF116 domain-containing protein [Planctomycetota bacterium]HRR81663.1 DUF116 domain-containing protein [Planctomycetota bacterium]
MWSVAEQIGRAVAAAALAGLTCVALSLAIAVRVGHGGSAPLKRFALGVLELLYLPLRMLWGALPVKAPLDVLMVRLRNEANRGRLAVARRGLVLAPACLRHLACAAPSSRRGIQCGRCGLCKLQAIHEEGARVGWRVFILTGSAYVPRLVAEERPEAALLVACAHECNKVMMALGRLPTYGVPLTRNGCVATDVDLDRVRAALRLSGWTDANGAKAEEHEGTGRRNPTVCSTW